MKRTLCLCVLLVVFTCWLPPSACALDAWRFTFGDGTSDQAKVEDARTAKVYENGDADSGSRIVKYIHLESFERSLVSSREQQTVFAYGEAKYYPVLSGGMTLATVSLHYVILDYQGRLQPGGKSWVLHLDAMQPKNNSLKPGPGAKAFYQQLPAWAQTQLHLISGYLEKTPGRPVLRFDKTDAEAMGSIVTGFLSLAPGVLKSALGQVVENALKGAGTDALKNAIQSDELHHGSDYRVRDEQILKNRATYEEAGVKMWSFAQP